MPGEAHTTIIIVGLGAMGSSAAYHLAKRGVRVLGIDQFPIAHDRGSSHGFSRMIRMCYYEHPDYVPLLRRAYELWRELEQASGQTLLHTPGGVYMGRESSDAVAGSHRAAVQHGLPHELLTCRQLGHRYPQFHVPADYCALFEPAAGWLAPERVIRAATSLAIEHGAVLRTGERVVEWHADSQGVRVWTDKGEYRAERLIIAVGAWAGAVINNAAVHIAPTRQVLGWFTPRTPALFAQGTMPVWAMQTPPESDKSEGGGDLFYGFPMPSDPADSPTGVPAFKLARHAKGASIDPSRDSREPRADDENDIRPFLRRFIPEADGPLAALRICVYENSADSHFIIDRHPAHENVIVAAGFSGHGFKFASVVGEVLADLAMRGDTTHPINFLRLSRFQRSGSMPPAQT